jgi:NAD(P)-dependent dehydrogenase (short-subunit alcohol dehydrogenase family)
MSNVIGETFMTQAQRVVIVTGASSGIGLETAKQFASMGWHVIGQGRNPERCAAAEAVIREKCEADGKVDFLRANLSLMKETKRLASEIKSLTDHVDVLINNAGGIRDGKYLTAEGTEETFAGNHLAPFLLTRELMPLIEAAAAIRPAETVRIIAVSSVAYAIAAKGLNFGDIQHLEGVFTPRSIYCEAKLANQLFNVALNARLDGTGIVSQSLVPGPVYTNFFSYGDDLMKAMIKTADALTPEQVADTLVWIATARETGAPGGRMFYELEEKPVLPLGTDMAAAERLWDETEQILAGLGV